MAEADIVIVDYGVGNLLSVRRGFEHCGASVLITGDRREIERARRVVLPGVGAFATGMTELVGRGLNVAVTEVARRGRPLLGICLGMQLLFDESEEFGSTAGLGLISGSVVAIPAADLSGRPQKTPHIGWNELLFPETRDGWADTPLQGLAPGAAVYFLHSFMATPSNARDRLADCLYGDTRIAAVVGSGSVLGCQFHPEKSGEAGLSVLRRFLQS